MRAIMGVPWRLSTLLHSLERGMARSRAKAHVVLEAATVMEMEQKRVTMRTRAVRAMPPALVPITRWKIMGRTWPRGAARRSSSGGRVAQIGMI